MDCIFPVGSDAVSGALPARACSTVERTSSAAPLVAPALPFRGVELPVRPAVRLAIYGIQGGVRREFAAARRQQGEDGRLLPG